MAISSVQSALPRGFRLREHRGADVKANPQNFLSWHPDHQSVTVESTGASVTENNVLLTRLGRGKVGIPLDVMSEFGFTTFVLTNNRSGRTSTVQFTPGAKTERPAMVQRPGSLSLAS